MAEEKPTYNESERQVLRQAREFRELVEHAGWKELVKIIEHHIAMKQEELAKPIAVRAPEYQVMDAGTKLAVDEANKGAIIAMRLVLSLPTTTISEAQEIVRESRGEEESSQ